MRKKGGENDSLRSVGVTSGVSHGKESSLGVLDGELFVGSSRESAKRERK